MSKRIAIIIIVIILAITAIVYVGIWNAKKEASLNPVSQNVQTVVPAADSTADNAANSVDGDVADIEADFNSMSDDSFGADTLSDEEVGL